MTAVRLAAVLAVLALASSTARAEYVTLANSPSVQARWHGEWEKTHPANNQSNPVARAASSCTVVVDRAARIATCR